MTLEDYRSLALELESLLKLQSPALAITFSYEAPLGVSRFSAVVPEPSLDGRTGPVAAGCVFWMKAAEQTFTTVAEDHANCSVGSLTHGLKTLQEVADREDVSTLLASGWVTMDMVPRIPHIRERPGFITYGPLRATPVEPDVALMRLVGKQVMVLHDAVPQMRFEGKPQCHIIAIAKEDGEIAVSVGCMLSRVRTGMSANEMTCVLPAKRLAEVVERLRATYAADGLVAAYASRDAARFSA
jgi:uncharacterized protein (DUF169 family)